MDERSSATRRIAALTRPPPEAPHIGGFFAVLEAVVLASPSSDPESNPATETMAGRFATTTEGTGGGDR
jgi:hypothetical protein